MRFATKEDLHIWRSFMRQFHTSTERADHFGCEQVCHTITVDGVPQQVSTTIYPRYRPRGYQYQKLDRQYPYTLHLIDYNVWKDTELNVFVLMHGILEYVKHPQIWIETCSTYDKLSTMYARIKMEDIVSFGKKWFHAHLNNIVLPEHKENAKSCRYYYPISVADRCEFVVSDTIRKDY